MPASSGSTGLEPAAADGSYFQRVPLVGITPDPRTELVVTGSPQVSTPPLHLAYKDDVVAWSKRMVDTVALDRSELVFVGYGVQAPEFTWDDYKGTDLKGKTLVFLIGDPPVPDPRNPAALDPRVFGGKAMTYYGRWTYKLEMAAKMGAAGALIIHETAAAGYPFSVVQVKVGEQFDIARPDRNMSRAAVEGWLSGEAAARLLARAGTTLDALKKAALRRDFRPRPLGLFASMTIRNTVRAIDSRNVLAKLPGSDPALRNETSCTPPTGTLSASARRLAAIRSTTAPWTTGWPSRDSSKSHAPTRNCRCGPAGRWCSWP